MRLLVVDEAMADAARVALRAAGADCERISCQAVPTDDAWLRDSGPLFVKRDSDGARALLTTGSCLLNTNREPRRTHEQMERRLAEWLGARHVIWLLAGIVGDDTEGHVDDIARCVAPSRTVASTALAGS